MKNKVSIIIPTYNGSETIQQTLESVLLQEYTNYEIIVVDDGSTDNTVSLVETFIPSARIIEQHNQGTLAARQAGIDEAQGDLIALLDQDDLWFKNNLHSEVNVLQKRPEIGLVLANMQAVDEYGHLLGFNVVPESKCYTPSWEELLLLHPIANSVALFRKQVVAEIGGLDRNFRFSGALGDSDTFVRMREVTNIHFINEIFGQYCWSETRPGRLISFLDNLQVYAGKYWDRPLLKQNVNTALRGKFVQVCCNYALHIYRLLLKQYNNRVPTELFLKLNKHNKAMEDLFGELYRTHVGLKSFDLGDINPVGDALTTLLFLYLLRLDLQKAFPQVLDGRLRELVKWGVRVAKGRFADGDNSALRQYSSDLVTASETGSYNSVFFATKSDDETTDIRNEHFSANTFFKNWKGNGILLLSSIGIKILPIGSRRRRLMRPLLTIIKILLTEGSTSLGKRSIHYLGNRIKMVEFGLKEYSQTIRIRLNLGIGLVFHDFVSPKVAIVVRVGGEKHDTFRCLSSLLTHLTVPYRVIVVLSEGSKVNRTFLNRMKNIVLIENPENLASNVEIYKLVRGYIKNEKYVLFLANDIWAKNDCLDPMLKMIECNDECGAVSCKMVSLSGKYLLEAGRTMWNDGRLSIYGLGDSPDKPQYSYVRPVDFVSPDCLLVKKEVLDNLYASHPLTVETDLSRLITESGYCITYQPASIVFKRVDEKSIMDKANESPERYSTRDHQDYLRAGRIGHGAKILVIDDYIPAIRYGSGFPRLYEMLICMTNLGCSVTFLPVGNPVKVQPETSDLQQVSVEVFWGDYANLEQFAKERSGYYDIVLISRPHVFERIKSTVQQHFANAAILYDAEALFYIREMLKAEINGSRIHDEQRSKMIRAEMNLIESADLVIAVSQNTKDIMRENSAQKNIEVWEHIQDMHESNPHWQERVGILFFGSFFAGPGSPNEDAILYFVSEIFPEIRKALGCNLYIVGGHPTPAVKDLASTDIVVTGYVEDLRQYFDVCRINVVPTRFAAGIPLKLLEVMSYGIPSVVSELIAQQLSLSDKNQVLIAHNHREFSEKIADLYLNEELWTIVNRNSIDFVRSNFSRPVMLDKLDLIIKQGLKIRDTKKLCKIQT